MSWVKIYFVKCQNCYAQIKSDSNICEYCGFQLTIKKSSNNKENLVNDNSVSLTDEQRLSPEFRHILGYDANQKRSSESDELNYYNKYSSESKYFNKNSSRKWGITQSIIEFFIYCVLINLLDGYYEQQEVVVAIYLIWSFIRAFNFFVLKRSKI